MQRQENNVKWSIPISLFLLGVLLVVGAMAYMILAGEGVPDQDPTPAMEAESAFHHRVGNVLFVSGGAAMAAAFVALLLMIGWRVVHRRGTALPPQTGSE